LWDTEVGETDPLAKEYALAKLINGVAAVGENVTGNEYGGLPTNPLTTLLFG
jgi:hypothetical protein